MANEFTCTFDSSALFTALDNLGDKAVDAVRPAAYAGATVFYDELKARVPMSAESREHKGKTYNPGTLKAAIYHAFSPEESRPGHAVYKVSYNAKKAPHGHLAEYGYWQRFKVIKTKAGWRVLKDKKGRPIMLATPKFIPAHPFIRPAYAARQTQALQASQTRFAQLLKQPGTPAA